MSSSEGRSRNAVAFALVLTFSFLSKLGLALFVWFRNPAAIWHPDSTSYHSLALNMLRHGVFSRSSGPPFAYEVFRTPGYPLLLATAYSLFGVSALPVIFIQAAIATGTVALTWLLGRRLFSPRVGKWAAIILSLDVASVCLGQMLLSETTFTLLMLAAVWLLVRSLSPVRGWAGFFLSGLALACAVYVRPVAYYLVLLGAVGVALYFALKDRGAAETRPRWRPALSRASAFLLAPVVLVGGWQLKNLQKTGNARFSHLEGQNMYFYRAAGAISMRDHKPLFQVHRELGLETGRTDFSGWVAQHPEFAGRSDAAWGEEWLHEGVAVIFRNPGWYALVQLRGTAALLLEPGTYFLAFLAGFESGERGRELIDRVDVSLGSAVAVLGAVWSEHRFLFLSSLWGIAFLVLLYVGVVRWLARTSRHGWTPGVVVLVTVLVYLVLTSAGPEATSRFRVPMMPFLALLSAAGWLSPRRSSPSA
ncbi:glycosyltransferase family 39 protein [candidate division WOR-3 bacterium]|nr:glycosyltransferase family 39 protein [candidate division WOR-3 bacterium]